MRGCRCDIKGASPGGDPLALASLDPDARWVTADYKAGDVVLFTMHTLHGGIRNETDRQLRLSADLRFQPGREQRDERWIGRTCEAIRLLFLDSETHSDV